ncbi:MAG: hypothetical protein HY747_03940 [Elusimicrobia bacterium]|nr:hypothetical protein [Elusimicrobiota bacterium]
MKNFLTLFALSALSALPSCVATRQDVAGLEGQIAQLNKGVSAMEKKQAELSQRLDEIKKPVNALNSNLNDTQNLLNNFNPKLEEIRSLIETLRKETSQRVQEIVKKMGDFEQSVEEKLAALKKAVPAAKGKTQAGQKEKKSDNSEAGDDSQADVPLKTFQAAYKDFLAKRWDLAQNGFGSYLKSYPDGSLADKSFFYMAQCLREKKMIPAAHDSLDKLTARFPKSPVSRAGMLEKAKLFLDESKTSEAEGMLEYLVVTHPQSKEAEQAKEFLKTIPHK